MVATTVFFNRGIPIATTGCGTRQKTTVTNVVAQSRSVPYVFVGVFRHADASAQPTSEPLPTSTISISSTTSTTRITSTTSNPKHRLEHILVYIKLVCTLFERQTHFNPRTILYTRTL
jgi:hypothetical protein